MKYYIAIRSEDKKYNIFLDRNNNHFGLFILNESEINQNDYICSSFSQKEAFKKLKLRQIINTTNYEIELNQLINKFL